MDQKFPNPGKTIVLHIFDNALALREGPSGPLSEAQSMNGVIRSQYVTQCRVDLVVESEMDLISSLPSNGRRDRTDIHV